MNETSIKRRLIRDQPLYSEQALIRESYYEKAYSIEKIISPD